MAATKNYGLWDSMQNPTGSQTGNQALGGLAGAALGYFMQPKQNYHTTSKAQLDAATLPAMQQAAQQRQAQLNSVQSAQGGLGSAAAYENVALRTQNAQNIAQQGALNQVAATNSQNAAAQMAYQNKMHRIQAALSMMKGGANLFMKKPSDKNNNSSDPLNTNYNFGNSSSQWNNVLQNYIGNN